MLRGRTETRSIIIDSLNYEPSQRFDGWTKITVIFSCKWIVEMGKINYSFEIHHLSVWVFPRASARLANSLVSFFRVAVYLVLISNMLTDGKAHQRQHNRDEEYSLDKRRHDGTWNWARSICRHANNWMTLCDPPIVPRDKRCSNVNSISWETHERMLKKYIYQERVLLINRNLDRVAKLVLPNVWCNREKTNSSL